MKRTIDDINFKGLKVIMRVDFNVPMKDGKITSNKRILAALPSIKKVLNDGGSLILLSHLGRIKTEEDKASKSLLPVAQELANQLQINVKFITNTRSEGVTKAAKELQPGEVLLLENTRFEDLNDKAESKNNEALGKYWASLADVFVNDAFGTAHRAHASNVGIAKNIKTSAVGYLMNKEIEALWKVLNAPEKPFVAIIGGAKISDKILVLENLIDKVDKIIIGGGMAYTFLKAQGQTIGKSLLDETKIDYAKDFLAKHGKKVILPVDFRCAKEFADVEATIFETNIPDEYESLDIGPKTEKLYEEALKGTRTIIWNGPLGVTEFDNYKNGTFAIAKAIAQLDNCYSVVGGGDSAAAVEKLNMAEKFSHISTGGGASLEFLQGNVLPGVEAMQEK